MTPERYRRVGEICHAALQLESGLRTAFLDEACAGDDELRREAESLLALRARAENFIETPAAEVVARALAEDRAALPAGRRTGRYEVVSLLARGGMGEIYLARDAQLGRRVALKLLPEEFTRDESRVRRFEQEARAASALNHPNIVTVYEVGLVDGLHFIATEFVEGQTLRQRLKASGMSAREALETGAQVAGALAAAHAAGVIHRDIKPENVMLRPDGYVKVLDFGLAKLTEGRRPVGVPDATTQPDSLTNPGTVMGTVTYMSPEQARGLAVDARSDIFSLGVVCYEMIAGHVPFAGQTASDVIASILDSEPPPPSAYSPKVPAGLDRIVIKALAKDKGRRYQTAEDLVQDLRGLSRDLEFQSRLSRSGRPASGGAHEDAPGGGQATSKSGAGGGAGREELTAATPRAVCPSC